jgi:ATP-dependent Lon protease
MPEGVRKVFEVLAKLQGLELAASEANVTRNYLDWLIRLGELWVHGFSGLVFTVGGSTDVAEIKGHRRTFYVG